MSLKDRKQVYLEAEEEEVENLGVVEHDAL